MGYIGSLLIFMLCMAILAEAFDCVAVRQNNAFDGWSCQPFSHKDIANIPYHHCSLTCIQRPVCQAYIYDKEVQLCMMLSNPCVWTQPHVGHIYVISKPQCVSWERHDKDYHFYWYYEGTYKSYVGRRFHQGDMLVGKVTADFFSIDPKNFSIISGGTYENLVVDSFCQVIWVTYDTYGGHPLPSEAVIGGVLSTTNTPLFVARQFFEDKYIVGYYNLLNHKAWGSTYISGRAGALHNTVFEVMTVTHLWPNWLRGKPNYPWKMKWFMLLTTE